MSLLGDGLTIRTIPLLVLQLTRSPVAAALASVPRTIGYLLVGLPSGPIVDRCDPWSLLIAMDIVRGAVFGTLYLLTVAHIRSVAVILALAVLAAVAGIGVALLINAGTFTVSLASRSPQRRRRTMAPSGTAAPRGLHRDGAHAHALTTRPCD